MSGVPGASQTRSSEKANHVARPSNAFVWFAQEEIEQSIPARFEQQVRVWSSRTAIKTGNHQFTYSDLNQAANCVAQSILDRNGEGEQRVALLMQHEAPLIAAIIGILKAGKACVPLDPSYPESKAAFILEDTQSTLIITDNRYLSEAGRLVQDPSRTINFGNSSAPYAV